MNLLTEANKPEVKRTIVVYAGRFQPFHPGHYGVYKHLVSKFGKNNVYIGSSDDTSGPKSPLRFKEKKAIATNIFDVPADKFVKVKNPYSPAEILDKYDGKTTQYVAALGEKDSDRLSGRYFKPYKGKQGYGYDEIGYTYTIPPQAGGISATDIRKGIGHKNEKVAREFFKKVYPKFNEDIFQTIRAKLLKLKEDFPGGVGTGLTLPGGYINGAPNPKDVKKMRKNLDKEKTNQTELYNPIQELVERTISNEMFEEFANDYFGESKIDEKEETTADQAKKQGLKSRGFGRWSKDDKGPITHKTIDGKLTQLSPDESEAETQKDKKGVGDEEGGTDNKKAKEQKPEKKDTQAIKPADLQSDAEKRHKEETNTGDADSLTTALYGISAGAATGNTKQALAGIKKIWKDFTTEEQHEIHHASDPKSEERKSWKEKAADFIKNPVAKLGKTAYALAKEKTHQFKNTAYGLKSLMQSAASGRGAKFGMIKDKEGKLVHHTDFKDKVPVMDDKTGKQKTNTFGKKQYQWVDKPNLSEEQIKLKIKSEAYSKAQRKATVSTVKDAAVLAASIAVTGGVGGGLKYALGKSGEHSLTHAVTHGAGHAFSSLGTFAADAAKDFAKHCGFESVGLSIGAEHHHATAGATVAGAVHGIANALSEEKDENTQNGDILINLITDILKRMETFKPSPEQLYGLMARYQKDKKVNNVSKILEPAKNDSENAKDEHMVPMSGMFNRKLTPQQKIDKLNPARAKQKSKIWHQTFAENDNTSVKKQNIKDFVEYATKRLKLKEAPKINVNTREELGEDTTTLGGYNPETKEIHVQIENRLSADILRTIAHEMVHYKQDELGLIKDIQKDGATGSPIENQANSIAGILLREYGKRNKKIYTETLSVGGTIIPDTMDPVIGKLKTKLQSIYKSLQDVNYNTGIKEYTFIFGNKNDAFDFQNKFRGYNGQKLEFDRSNDYTTEQPPYYVVTFRTPNSVEMRETIKKVGDKYVVYPKKGGKRLGTHSSMASAKKQLAAIEINKEHISIDVNPGDEVLMGKFKNKKIKVKDIGQDDHGMPTINGRQATTFRTINEVSTISTGNDDQPNGMFLPKGRKRILGKKDGVNKEDLWFTNGGYTQVDFPTAGAIFGDEDEITNVVKYSDDNIPKFTGPKTKFTKGDVKTLNEKLILEGGAAGHMAHPFDDMDLTFGDLKNIITGALNGELGIVKEKLDGQALAISWKNGRLIAARNKGHLEKAGANAMGIEDVASKFAGRGALTNAYNFAMKDLNAAISGLSKKQQQKIFNEGRCFMNIEVLWPESANVIPYGQALLVFHNTTCYDDDGKPVGADAGAARTLAGMINQINANVQDKYTIKGPAVTEIPKNQELSSKQGQFLSKLNKLQNEFGCKDGDTVAVYHQRWWENYIEENAPTKVDKLTKDALVRRWAFGDKSFRLNTISNQELQDWSMKTDKIDLFEKQKENMSKFEDIFLGVGSEVLQFVSSAAAVNPNQAVRSMKDELKTAISTIKKSGDSNKIEKFKNQLKKLNKLGGAERIVPIEGIVFSYNDKVYKLTGTFAPLNQILGLMKYA